MTIIKNDSHVEEAKARIPGYLRGAVNFNKMVEIFANRFQILEDELDLLLNNITSLTVNAVGVQLDTIGIILDLTRIVGEADAEYRIRLQGEAAALAKSGEPETVIDAFKLITVANSVLLLELIPATIELVAFLDDDTLTASQDAAIIVTMQAVIAAGVGTMLLTCVGPCFLWGDSADADGDGNLPAAPTGFGDTADADVNGNILPGVGGGNWARVLT